MRKVRNWDRLLFIVHQQQVNLIMCFSHIVNFRHGVMQIAVCRITCFIPRSHSVHRRLNSTLLGWNFIWCQCCFGWAITEICLGFRHPALYWRRKRKQNVPDCNSFIWSLLCLMHCPLILCYSCQRDVCGADCMNAHLFQWGVRLCFKSLTPTALIGGFN